MEIDRMRCADCSADAGSCASKAAAIWFCARNRFLAVTRSGTSAIADFEPLADRRQRCDQFRAVRNQRGDALDSIAIVGEPLRDAIDHLLLLGGKLQPRFLQQRAQRRSRLPDLTGRRRRIGDEVARRQPQLIGAAVDFLRHIANALKVLQLGKGRIDVADRDHARDAGNHDHRQQQHESWQR